jgi:hypothetical protein
LPNRSIRLAARMSRAWTRPYDDVLMLVAATYAVAAARAIPRFGWMACVGVCLGCELLLAVLIVVAVKRRVRGA